MGAPSEEGRAAGMSLASRVRRAITQGTRRSSVAPMPASVPRPGTTPHGWREGRRNRSPSPVKGRLKAAAQAAVAGTRRAPRPTSAPSSRKAAASATGPNAMLDPRRYWDALGASKRFDEEVISTIDEDMHGRIRELVREYAMRARTAHPSARLTAYDFGAGSGRYLPTLAPLFDRIVAVDISPKLIEKARALTNGNNWRHVDLGVENLAKPTLRSAYPRAHFGVLANVLLSTSQKDNAAILEEVALRLLPHAALLVVVPSTEAALYIRQRLVDARLEKELGSKACVDIPSGVFKRGGVKTKHWLREELELLARKCGFVMERIGKVEFPWNSEVDDVRVRKSGVPLALNVAPYPYDHLAVLRRIDDGADGNVRREGLISVRNDLEARGCLTSSMLERQVSFA